MFRKHIIVFFCLIAGTGNITLSQNEFFGTLDYQNLTFTRLAPIPSVTWLIDDNSAYDQKNHRYFFIANATQVAPWYLYTVDAITGAVLSQVPCPSNYNSSDNIFGLQFDNESGILYGLHNPQSTAAYYLSSIDPSTGNVIDISMISQLTDYDPTQNTFSSKNHIYFCTGNDLLNLPTIFAINAINGQVIWKNNSGRFYELAFDNAKNRLYGLEFTAVGYGQLQFDSFELATGMQHKISSLPTVGLAQLPTTTIDEKNERYIFLGEDQTQCATRRLYVLNVNNGQVVSDQSYPYAEATGDPNAENVLSFSFDNVAGRLYALNWHVADSIRSDIFRIAASVNPVCRGDSVTFITNTPVLLQAPTYHWIVNSSTVGITGPNFSSTRLSDGDTVYCIVTDTLPCDVGQMDTSNMIVEHLRNPVDSAFNITASANDICQGDSVVFTALTNTNPDSLTWKIDGSDAGHGDALITNSLMNGDKVSCVEANDNGCTLAVASANTISMTVLEKPLINFSPDTIFLEAGTSVQLMPHITGSTQAFLWSPSLGLSDTTVAEPIASPLHDTKYYLTAGIPEVGCFSVASVFIKITYPDTVNCLNFKNVKAYPNPSSDKMLVSFGSVWKSGEIVVFNSIGQRISALKIENQDYIYLYKNYLASGLYTLKFICLQSISGILPIIFTK
jgi:hypothetical protein